MKNLLLLAATALTVVTLRADDGTWTAAAGGAWTDPANWTAGVIADGANFSAHFTSLDLTADATVTLGVDRTLGALSFGDTDTGTAAGWTITGNTLTLAGATPTITVGPLGGTAGVTITSTLAGVAGFTKEGTGQLTISNTGNAGLSGPLVVNAGLLVLDTTADYNDALAKSSVITVNAGAELRFTGGANNLVRNATDGAIVLNGGTLDYRSATHGHMGDITLNNGATWKASAGGGYNGENMQLNGDVTVGGTAASTIGNFSSGLSLNGTRTFAVADASGDAAADLTISATLKNNDGGPADGIIKTGAGTLVLAASNAYTGATTVNGGTLRLTAGGSGGGTASITVNNGATLETAGTNIFVGSHGTAIAATKTITLNASNWVMTSAHDARIGSVVLHNGSTWTSQRGLSGYDALLGNITSGAATIAVTGTGASAMVGTGGTGIHLQGVQNFDVADTTGDAGSDLSVSMVLADPGATGGAAGGLNKLGAGTMTLSSTNTFTGGTTVNAGTLVLNTGGSSGAIRGTVTVNTGATLRLDANDATGYATDGSRLSAINLVGGALSVNTTANQTLGSAVVTMTGASITGIANSNLDLFGGASAITTLASATGSTISGVKLTSARTAASPSPSPTAPPPRTSPSTR